MKLKDVQVVPSCGFGDNENIWRNAQGMKDSESKKMVVKVQLPMSATSSVESLELIRTVYGP